MNVEQTKEHGDVIKWWIDNPNLSVWVKDKYGETTNGWELTNIPTWALDYMYVQNDKYAELRKAQADGATLQVNTINGWKDIEPSRHISADEIRIKPDEPKFKVGDWVRCIDGSDEVEIFIIDDENIYSSASDSSYELWKPTEGKLIVLEYGEDTWIVKPYSYDFTEEDYIKPLEFIQTLKDK